MSFGEKMNKTDNFNQYNLKNTSYDYINSYINNDFCGLIIHGYLNDKSCEHHYYDMYFSRINLCAYNEQVNQYQNGILKDISVTVNKDNFFDVHIELENCSGIIVLDFQCELCNISFLHYRGIDYTNVYNSDEYKDMLNKYLYLENEKYFSENNIVQITDEFSLAETVYLHEDKGIVLSMSCNQLLRNGETIYNYMSIDHHHNSYKKLIYHSNGHRYYPYNVDLYGISYIDVDSLERYDYIPKGYDNNYGLICGESFIITDIYYDSNTNLVAYEGCYWAGTSDVMVGDLTNPLNFNPYLISIHVLLDPDYEEFDDVDFGKWNEHSLTVKIDNHKTIDVDFDTIVENLSKDNTIH